MKQFLPSVFLLFLLLSFTSSAGADTFSCLACHSAMKGKIRAENGVLIDVNVDSERYSLAVHGGFDCLICHKQFSGNPHEPTRTTGIPKNISELANRISHKAKVDPVALAACIECHEEVYGSWKESIHGENVVESKQSDGAVCTDCHGSPHYITQKKDISSLVNRKNVVKTCGQCHDNPALAKKYNLGTHILDRYYESFHGKKYILGHQNAPTCVNCHRYHDIKKWDDPKSPVAWDNRMETCGKCHAGATRKFVAAITHKPIGKGNPIPYYSQKGLILLTMSVFAFIILHVALDLYADIRDRVFRKKEEAYHEE